VQVNSAGLLKAHTSTILINTHKKRYTHFYKKTCFIKTVLLYSLLLNISKPLKQLTMSQLPVELPVFTDDEMATIRTALGTAKAVIASKFVNLEPADRTEYGSISEKNKLIINKVWDYRVNMPHLSNDDVDWDEYKKQNTTRTNFKNVMALLAEIDELCDDPRILVDYSLFGLARQDYKWTKYKAEDDGGNGDGYEAKYNDLKQFFVHDNEPPYVVVDDDDEDEEDENGGVGDTPTP
jgi:hypothetical protein